MSALPEWADELPDWNDAVELPSWEDERGVDETRRIWKAMMLAPTHEICAALLRGEVVPIERLDQGWAGRFGLR